MTKNERRFLELQLEMDLRKLKRNLENVPIEELRTKYQRSYKELCQEIKNLANQYVPEMVFHGMGCWVRSEKKQQLFQEIERVLNRPQKMKDMKAALFETPDMETVKALVLENRRQVEKVIKKYQEDGKKGKTNGKG